MKQTIEIYTKDNCGYCTQAKHMLNSFGISYTERKLGIDFTREDLLEWYPSAKSYPVVVADGFHLGGAAELALMLESQRNERKQILNEARGL